MEHLDVQLAHRLLRRELPPELEAQWLRHTDRCARCRDLLANEKALTTVLGLGDAEESAGDAAGLGRVLDKIDDVAPGRPWLNDRLLQAVAGVVALGLTLLLAGQISGTPAETPLPAVSELGIRPAVEERVIANMDSLAILEGNPWLVHDYEVVETLERLIAEGDGR